MTSPSKIKKKSIVAFGKFQRFVFFVVGLLICSGPRNRRSDRFPLRFRQCPMSWCRRTPLQKMLFFIRFVVSPASTQFHNIWTKLNNITQEDLTAAFQQRSYCGAPVDTKPPWDRRKWEIRQTCQKRRSIGSTNVKCFFFGGPVKQRYHKRNQPCSADYHL